MYRSVRSRPVVGMSGFWSSIFNSVKGAVSGIKITAPPISFPQTQYQLPGTSPPGYQVQPNANATPDWLLPVAIGGAGLLAVMMLSQRGRR